MPPSASKDDQQKSEERARQQRDTPGFLVPVSAADNYVPGRHPLAHSHVRAPQVPSRAQRRSIRYRGHHFTIWMSRHAMPYACLYTNHFNQMFMFRRYCETLWFLQTCLGLNSTYTIWSAVTLKYLQLAQSSRETVINLADSGAVDLQFLYWYALLLLTPDSSHTPPPPRTPTHLSISLPPLPPFLPFPILDPQKFL